MTSPMNLIQEPGFDQRLPVILIGENQRIFEFVCDLFNIPQDSSFGNPMKLYRLVDLKV